MKTYLQNGLCYDRPHIIDEQQTFSIQEINSPVEKYIHTGDEILYDLDGELVLLYDTLRDLYFNDTKSYYREFESLPQFVIQSGQNSDFPIDTEKFKELINEFTKTNSNINRYLYLVDCQYLVGTIQNLLSGMEDCLCNFFVNLSQVDVLERNIWTNTIVSVSSYQSRNLSALLETYFTKAYSILDVLCKIAFEIENPNKDFTTYKKLRCAKVLWGDRKRLNMKNTPKTVFENTDTVKMIEAIRNEVVHNGTWELNPKVFVSVDDGEIKERFMLFPDFREGHLDTVINRRHFFSGNIKVNNILPTIHTEYLQMILNTVKHLNSFEKNIEI